MHKFRVKINKYLAILKPSELLIAIICFFFVLMVQNSIPFVLHPSLGIGIWTAGFAESIANNSSWLNLYAHDFGIPKPAPVTFGLSAVWPMSILVRLGFHVSDAYALIFALWIGIAMAGAYFLARKFGSGKFIAIFLAMVWLTTPITYKHSGYSMVSLGFMLLPTYFLAATKLFLVEKNDINRSYFFSIIIFIFATVIAVFMDGYSFMMFATGSGILFIYLFCSKLTSKNILCKMILPVYVFSFSLSYILYKFYVNESLDIPPSSIKLFRTMGVDLSFLIIPTKGVHWLSDFINISMLRPGKLFFGDGSVWSTTFSLPLMFFGLISWWLIRHKMRISTGFLLIAFFAFYMSLGPSLKIFSTKPADLQEDKNLTYQSYLMESQYTKGATGNAWISENIPGFKHMRSSYRWTALMLLSFWVIFTIWISMDKNKHQIRKIFIIVLIILLNIPHLDKTLVQGYSNRNTFNNIDNEIVSALMKNISKDETVAFLPYSNDFLVNYLAPKAGFRTYNIGGDKNLYFAKRQWPDEMLMSEKIDQNNINFILEMLRKRDADVVVLPYFDLRWSSYEWPCQNKTGSCIDERKSELANVLKTIKEISFVNVHESELFVTIRLKNIGQ